MAAYEWTYNGFTWGDDELDVVEVTGLLGMDLNLNNVARFDRGSTVGYARQPERTFTQSIELAEDDPAAQQARLDAARLAWAPRQDELPLVFEVDGTAKRVYCRPVRHSIPIDVAFAIANVDAGGIARMVVQFTASDPLIFSDAEHSVSTSRAEPGAGLTLPFTLPATLPAATSTGAITATNNGTTPAPWTATIAGPSVNPSIFHVESGRVLDFSANGGLDLSSGQSVLIDSRARSVTLSDSGDRRYTLRQPESRWFDLEVGDNSIIFTADSGAGQLTFNHRDAWAS